MAGQPPDAVFSPSRSQLHSDWLLRPIGLVQPSFTFKLLRVTSWPAFQPGVGLRLGPPLATRYGSTQTGPGVFQSTSHSQRHMTFPPYLSLGTFCQQLR